MSCCTVYRPMRDIMTVPMILLGNLKFGSHSYTLLWNQLRGFLQHRKERRVMSLYVCEYPWLRVVPKLFQLFRRSGFRWVDDNQFFFIFWWTVPLNVDFYILLKLMINIGRLKKNINLMLFFWHAVFFKVLTIFFCNLVKTFRNIPFNIL